MQQPRIFISYSHDSQEHKDRVLGLADQLRREGVDAQMDQYEIAPTYGWAQWAQNELSKADFVIVVCTETYKCRFERQGIPDSGRGVQWEGSILTTELYEEMERARIIPVFFDSFDTRKLPTTLRMLPRYNLSIRAEYEQLYRRLTDQPLTPLPVLGSVRHMPPRIRPDLYPNVNTSVQEDIAYELATGYKRRARLHFDQGDLSASLDMLRRSRDHYLEAYKRNFSRHWAGVRWLSLDAVLSGNIEEPFFWKEFRANAQEAVDNNESEIWACGNLDERSFVALALISSRRQEKWTISGCHLE